MESFWLATSVALNVVQAVLLFFKDAINDFVKGLLTSRHDAEQRRKTLLRQLDAKIELLPNHYFLWLTGGVIYEHGKSPEEREQGKQRMDRSFQDLHRILGFIRVNRLEFSSPIQGLLENLTKATQAGEFILEEKFDVRTLSKKIDDVGAITQKIRNAIRAEID